MNDHAHDSERAGADRAPTGESTEPAITRRLTDWFDHFNLGVRTLRERPDDPQGDTVYVLRDVFTTYMGSWEPSDDAGCVPQWAREAYLRQEFLEAGADHHLFAAVLDRAGRLLADAPVRFWSDGFEQLANPDYDDYLKLRTKTESGWANNPIGSGSSYVPERGEAGPWCWAPEGAAEVMVGGGLPANHHLSTFAVWQEMDRADYEAALGQASDPDEPDEPDEPGEPTEPDGDAAIQIERRISPWAEHMHLSILAADERPDDPAPQSDRIYVVKDIFTTINGSWEPANEPYSIPQWARDAYLKPWGAPDYFDDAGADHHLFGAVLDADGELQRLRPLRFWSGGVDALTNPAYDEYVQLATKKQSGWINLPLEGDSSFIPERGQTGPWCWAPEGAADVVCGGGRPANQHVSTFVVWQEAPRGAEVITSDAGDATEPDEPGSGSPVEQRISEWGAYMRLQVRKLGEQTGVLTGDQEYVYVVADIFTTTHGSWELDDRAYALPQWARDAYLKPWGAPDYFDDAGADHHLFAAVIGPDGELLRECEILYWSDGFDKLGDPNYTGYIRRRTKAHSGWANIPIGPNSSFVPERRESGPWCWGPVGAAEVVSGGGLPADQHVSTFVVWQAVARDALEPGEGGEIATGDHQIYIPTISGPGGEPVEPAAASHSRESDADAALGQLRGSAWLRLGFEGGQYSALAVYARRHSLGMPVTGVYRHEDLMVQGYLNGIVFHEVDKPETVRHTDW